MPPRGLIALLGAAIVVVVALTNWVAIKNFVQPPRQLPGLEMASISPGKFDMTILVPSSLGRKYHAKTVDIKRSFEISRFEITIDQWNICFKDGGCPYKAKQRRYQKGDHPVTRISWYDAQMFTKWLSGETGERYRLPTEEEWNYAAFVGKDVTKKTIDDLIDKRRQKKIASMSRFVKTKTIGAVGDNKWGVSDVTGPVWEWTMTCWFSSDEENKRAWSIAQLSNPKLCSNRVVQGDERAHVPFFVDQVLTGGCGTGSPIDFIGFRVVKELDS